MEHRWGQRVTIGAPIKLRGAVFGWIPAQLRDVSISGAFVETPLALSPMTRVEVELRYGHAAKRKIAAFVTRSDAQGIALEWRVLAPEAIIARLARPVKPSEAPTRAVTPDPRVNA